MKMLFFDIAWFQDFFASEPGWNDYVNNPAMFGGYMNQAAMNLVADSFIAQLTMPETGAHGASVGPDGVRIVSPNFSGGIFVPINNGRYF
jgi:hypothetical protein